MYKLNMLIGNLLFCSLIPILVLIGCVNNARYVDLWGYRIAADFQEQAEQDLVYAAMRGDSDKVRELHQSGVDVNKVGANGGTPLSWALASDNYRGVESLLRLGADPNLGFPGKIIYFAASDSSYEVLHLLLDYGADANSLYGSTSALGGAIIGGSERKVKLLIEYGADINIQYSDGQRTPITQAVGVGEYKIAHMLLESGYSGDLNFLAHQGENDRRQVILANKRWKAKVIERLQQLGVTYPLEPLAELPKSTLTESERVLLPLNRFNYLEWLEREGRLVEGSDRYITLIKDRELEAKLRAAGQPIKRR